MAGGWDRMEKLCEGLDKAGRRLLMVAAVRRTLEERSKRFHGWVEDLRLVLAEAEKHAAWERNPGLLDEAHRKKELRYMRDRAYYVRLVFWARLDVEGLLMAVQETVEEEIHPPMTLLHCCHPTDKYLERIDELEFFLLEYLKEARNEDHA